MLVQMLRIFGIVLFVAGAALFVGSGLLYWQGYSAVEKRSFWSEGQEITSDSVEELSPGMGMSDLRADRGGEQTEVLGVAVNLAVGEEVGEMYFPVLEATMPIFHGVSEDELVKGVGHVPGSGLPGDGGNIVLSGHRDTVFWRLGELAVGDKIVLEVDGGDYVYKVGRIRVVDKEDISVVVPRPREMLTITTCYPFRFIGSAPERYVVEAEFLGIVGE